MWELDCEEGWVLKNWCFWTLMLEKTLESPLDCKEIQPVHSEGDQPWVFFGRNDAKAETPVLWPSHAKRWLIGKDSDAGRDWGQEEKGRTEDEMTGWHHWLNGRESEWTPGLGVGQGGLACCDSWVAKSRTRLSDWTELNWRNHVKREPPFTLHGGACGRGGTASLSEEHLKLDKNPKWRSTTNRSHRMSNGPMSEQPWFGIETGWRPTEGTHGRREGTSLGVVLIRIFRHGNYTCMFIDEGCSVDSSKSLRGATFHIPHLEILSMLAQSCSLFCSHLIPLSTFTSFSYALPNFFNLLCLFCSFCCTLSRAGSQQQIFHLIRRLLGAGRVLASMV